MRTPKGRSYNRTSTSMSSSTTTASGQSKLQRLLPTHPYIWHIFGEHWKPLIWLSCFSCTIIYKLFPHIMRAIWVEVLQWKKMALNWGVPEEEVDGLVWQLGSSLANNSKCSGFVILWIFFFFFFLLFFWSLILYPSVTHLVKTMTQVVSVCLAFPNLQP